MRTGIVDFQSDRLRQLRIAQGLTQAVLAEKLSCSAGNISKWENGLSYPEIASFKRIWRGRAACPRRQSWESG